MFMCAVTVFFLYHGMPAHGSIQITVNSPKEAYKGKKLLDIDGYTELTINKVEACWKIGGRAKK